MRTIFSIALSMLLLLFTACDVHEWPDTAGSVELRLRLNYDAGMTEWKHLYDGTSVIEQGKGETYDNRREYGKMRYVVRACPVSKEVSAAQGNVREFVFTKDVAEGYDNELSINLQPGRYNIIVWSDLVESEGDAGFYNADDFSGIVLQGSHRGNTDYRDAFRGTGQVELSAGITAGTYGTLDIAMQRPLAKFEVITNDVKEFVAKETANMEKEAAAKGGDAPTRVDIDDYRVVFQYAGYMPTTYNMNTDKPVDAEAGVSFESKLDMLNEDEASLGFDYVFVNGGDAGVTVQIAVYGKEGSMLARSEPIDVPLRRNHHTIINGSFLMRQASGGITINPDFDGDHNIVIE